MNDLEDRIREVIEENLNKRIAERVVSTKLNNCNEKFKLTRVKESDLPQ